MAESPRKESLRKGTPGEEPAQQVPAKEAPVVEQPAGVIGESRPEESLDPAVSNADQLRPGKLFASFELEREFESGDTGATWLAQDYSVGRQASQVVLKFLPDSIVNDRTAAEECKKEIRRTAVLKHPNILRVFDLVEKKGRVAIQMEYLDGQSLSRLRMTRPNQIFEVRDLEKWVKQLCDALTYAHEECGLAGGGIVPGNLIVDLAGNLRLKDFGLATCITDSLTRLRVIGDAGDMLPYTSPQRRAGQQPATADDLYSLGAILYELLTGKPPFLATDLDSQGDSKIPTSMTKRRIELGIKGEPIPIHWEETVASCLAKDPVQRPQSAAEVEKRLKLAAAGADIPSAATKSGPHRVAKPRPPVRSSAIRGRWLLIAGILLLLMLGSAIAYFSFHHRPEGNLWEIVLKTIVSARKSLSSTTASPSPSGSTGKENFLLVPTPSPRASATSLAEASPALSPEVRATPSAEASPTPSPEMRATPSAEASAAPTPQISLTPTPEASPVPSAPETATSNGSPTALTQPKADGTKEEVIKRINALPGVTAEKKANLIEKMQKARSMERITVIPFDAGQTALRRSAADELLKVFEQPELRDKLSDPTIVLVVAGYADTGGRADKNLRISQERAENVSKILKEQVKLLNAMQTIGMGGTELLDNKLPGQNRAVEIWLVVPL